MIMRQKYNKILKPPNVWRIFSSFSACIGQGTVPCPNGCFIVNEYSTKSTKEYEKSTDSVQGQLFQEKSQPSQERESIFLEAIVNDFST